LKYEDVSKVVPYREGLSTFFSYAFPIIFLSEKITVYHTIGTLTIIFGTYIILSDGKKIIPRLTKGVLIVTISGIAIPVIGILSKVVVENLHPIVLNFFNYSLVALYVSSASIGLKLKELKETTKYLFKNKKLLGVAFASSFFATVGTLLLFFALKMGNASQVLPLSRTLPLFAVMYGSLFLKEKHGIARFSGAILIVAGMFFLNF
jgi:transporter family protein